MPSSNPSDEFALGTYGPYALCVTLKPNAKPLPFLLTSQGRSGARDGPTRAAQGWACSVPWLVSRNGRGATHLDAYQGVLAATPDWSTGTPEAQQSPGQTTNSNKNKP